MAMGQKFIRKALMGKYIWNIGGGLWCLTQLSTVFQLHMYIMVVSFIGGGPRQTLSHNVVSSTPHHVQILEHLVYEKKLIWRLKYKLNTANRMST